MTLNETSRGLDDPSRRAFLSGAAKSLLGLSAFPYLTRVTRAFEDDDVPLLPATARRVIYLYMSGGMSHLDTFDTKPGAETQGPTEAISTNVDGIRVSQHFPNLARHMDKVCVINSMSSTQGAHSQGRYFMHTSYELRGTIRHPSLGAWLDRMAGKINPTLPGHVAIGGDAYTASGGFFPSRYAPLPIGDPLAGLQHATLPKGVSQKTFDKRMERLAKMNQAFAEKHAQTGVDAYTDMYDQAVKLMSSRDLEAFDITKEDAALREAYGDDRFGQGCLLARRLVEHGVRFVEVVNGGWDTHNENFDAMGERCPPVDQALSALLADLDARGLLDDTLVVLTTEFGRTPQIVQERNGRNHYPKAFSALLAGGGIRGGHVHGKTNETGEEIVEGRVTVPDFNATIAHALGLPVDHILYSASGRPFTVAHKGQPVKEVFA
ncbi:MAG: DUF1501 domain-containing protein [Planctomycetes bacterium]|nr:DUF1501 domain-containing protein [Planctomycetota bacterium]